MSVDAHFHCWRLARGDYGWLVPALGVIHRDVSIEDWLRQARPLGVTGGVLVQAAPTEAETRFLLEQAEAHEEVLGVVGWVDLLGDDAPARIARMAVDHPKLRGLRPMLHDIDEPDWILQPRLAPAIESMARVGLVFDALVRPVHLPRLLTLCQRHPSLQVVIDHGAKPDIAANQWEPWASDLTRLADQTSAVCKLSGLLTEAGPRPAPQAARRWAGHVLDTFGADRVLWGSDWPVLERAANYGHWWAEVQTLLAAMTPQQRTAVLDRNTRRVYRLGGA